MVDQRVQVVVQVSAVTVQCGCPRYADGQLYHERPVTDEQRPRDGVDMRQEAG
jgi:hypothetical protein